MTSRARLLAPLVALAIAGCGNSSATDSHGCLTAYPDFCIHKADHDLSCDEIDEVDFAVEGDDPYGFDRDQDGIGCEVPDSGWGNFR